MSLKNVVNKITASIVAVYMVFGSFAIAGIGIGKVIAEDANIPKITIGTEVEKYVNYSNELGKGAVIQTKLSVGEEATQETHKEIAKTDISIEAPKIDGITPERVSIITANTKLTNGKEKGEISQNYNKETGLLNISYENKDNYSEYKENEKDEFEIIYIYSQEAYKENETEIKTVQKITANREYKTENEALTGNKEQNLQITLSKNIGELVSLEITNASDIYKGFMYSNEANKTQYTTNYQTTSNLDISNSQIIDELVIDLKKSSYITNDKNIVPTDTIIYYASIIDENDFNKLFGQDGYIDFYVESQKYATIRYLDTDEQGNRNFATVYVDENKENAPQAGKVEYPEKTTEVTIVTSKPQAEGNLKIESEKEIIYVGADVSVCPKVSQLQSIKEENKIEATKKYNIEQDKKDENGQVMLDENGNVQKEQIEKIAKINEKENAWKINLKEPTPQISMELSNNNFSTLTTNQTTLTIRLNDTNSSCKLFEAGRMEITLPNNLVSSKITNANALYTNGLNVKNAKIESGKIILNIEGKQTTYDTENISGGVNIVIDLELDIEDTVPSHEEKLQLTYGVTTATTNINIISKSGLLNYTNLSGYNENESITSIDETEKIATVDIGEDEKQVQLEATIVNNYDEDINNVEIIGKLPSVGNEDVNGNDIGSNVDTTLLTTVNVDNNQATVYYSEAENATSDSDTWTTTATNNSVAYKIELEDDTIEAKDSLNFEYKFEVPANLTYNEKAVTTYSVAYEINGVEQTANTTLTLATTEVPEIELKIEPNIDLDYVTGGQIVEYNITAKNKSEYDANNLSIQIPIPEGQIYTEYTNNGFDDYTQGGYLPNLSVNNKKYDNLSIQAGKEISEKIFLKMEETSEEKIIINTVNIVNNEGNTISTASHQTTVKPRQIIVENVYSTTNANITEEQTIDYMIYIENNSGEEKKNIKITDKLDEDLELEYIEDYLASSDENSEISYEIKRDNQVEFELGNLKAGDNRLINITVRAKNNTKYATKKIGNKVKLSANGIYDHESEVVYYTVKGFLPSIELTSSSETNIKEYEEINYTITVQNNSNASKEIKIVDEFPDIISPESYELYVYNQNDQQVDYASGRLGNKKVQLLYTIGANQKIIVYLQGKVDSIGEQETLEINNKAILYYGGYNDEDEDYIYKTFIESNIITTIIEKSPNQPQEDDGMVTVEDPEEGDIPEYKPGGNNNSDDNSGDNNTEDSNNSGGNVSNNNSSVNNNTNNKEYNSNYTYTIRGKVWIDENKNGKRDEGESGLSNVNVLLINNNGSIVLDSDSNQITTHTAEDGGYILEKVPKGSYLVAFEYDSNTYTVTSYKKQGVNNSINSDAIRKEVTINGEKKVRAITDVIKITDSGKSNIDVGFIKNAKFDISLNKQISSVTVTNAKGTKTTKYDNKNFAKIDLVAKYMNNTNLIITYEFKITNEGNTSSYVDTLTDNLPNGLEFNSELNKDWYKDSSGNLHTTSLSGIEIKPGETSTIELVLTKKTTENTTGTFSNNAELTKISNIEVIEEQTSAKENNKSSADLVISIKTGSVIMYIGITLLCVAIIGLGIFIIKKKILEKEV